MFCFDHGIEYGPNSVGISICPKCEEEICEAHDSLPIAQMKVDGHPVVIGVQYVTEPGEGWKGTQFVGQYFTIQELNKALPDIIRNKPDFWNIDIDFYDAREE